MTKLTALFRGFIRDEEGATAVEYGVLIALIIGVLILVIAALGQSVGGAFNTTATAIDGAAPVVVQ